MFKSFLIGIMATNVKYLKAHLNYKIILKLLEKLITILISGA